MNLTISKDLLLAGINAVMPAVASRTTNTVLTCIRLSTAGGRLTLDATDGDTYISTNLAVETPDTDPLLVPAQSFRDYIRGLAPGAVMLSFTGSALEISSGRNKATINARLDVNLFPAATVPDETTKLPDAALFLHALQTAYPFACSDARDHYTATVCLRATRGTLTMIGTDMSRLYVREMDGVEGEWSVLIPQAAAKAASQALQCEELSVAFTGRGGIYFVHSTGFCRVPTVDMSYPPPEQVTKITGFDSECSVRICVDSLKAMVQRQMSFTEPRFARCTFKASDGVLSAEGKQTENGYACDEAECEVTGETSAMFDLDVLTVGLSPFPKGADLLLELPEPGNLGPSMMRITCARYPDTKVIVSALTKG